MLLYRPPRFFSFCHKLLFETCGIVVYTNRSEHANLLLNFVNSTHISNHNAKRINDRKLENMQNTKNKTEYKPTVLQKSGVSRSIL